MLLASLKFLALCAPLVGVASSGVGLTVLALAGGPSPAGAPAGPVAQVAVPVVAQTKPPPPAPPVAAPAWPERDAAIQAGVRFLKAQQRADGSWSDADSE